MTERGIDKVLAKFPVQKGKIYDLEISEVGQKGDGIARMDGYIILVQGAKVGQKVKARVAVTTRTYAIANIVLSSDNMG